LKRFMAVLFAEDCRQDDERMSKKDKISIAHTDDFAAVEMELTNALEILDGANARVESLLREQKQPETEVAPMAADAETASPKEA